MAKLRVPCRARLCHPPSGAQAGASRLRGQGPLEHLGFCLIGGLYFWLSFTGPSVYVAPHVGQGPLMPVSYSGVTGTSQSRSHRASTGNLTFWAYQVLSTRQPVNISLQAPRSCLSKAHGLTEAPSSGPGCKVTGPFGIPLHPFHCRQGETCSLMLP